MSKHAKKSRKWQGFVDVEHRKACDLVMRGQDREMAFEDYALLISAFGVNGHFAVDGSLRSEYDHRQNPFGDYAGDEFLSVALTLADDAGIGMNQLASFFYHSGPETGCQALCMVEDAIVIMNHIPDMEDAQ